MHQQDTLPQKEKTKGVSFLSRLAIKGGKKKESVEDSDIVQNDDLIEGMNAHVFSSSVTASGFVPHYKEPPSYIRVRSRNKKQKIFDHMFLAQELCGNYSLRKGIRPESLQSRDSLENDKIHSAVPKSGKAIWAMEFSLDGRYLAAAGCDQIIRVWTVLSSPDERRTHELEEDASSEMTEYERLSAPVFMTKPIREYLGHSGDILDINWSKNNFLLTSSLDKTAKLWHPSRQECLTTFSQKELITSISFHPTDDRFFLSGSLDCILRLWSIPEKNVVFSCETQDPITAVAFTPNGSIAIAGGSSGLCHFYDIDQENGMRLSNQIHVRSSRGKNSKGSKITGIKTLFLSPDDQDTGDVNVLITSNDSRIRLYKLKDKRLEMKFQGHQNTHSQIKASFSCDGRYVICGSEDRKTYIWGIKTKDSEPKEPPLMEMFTAHSSIVTTAIFAPAATRRLLSGSGDPIYDICNPPPVTLLSLEEHSARAPESFENSSPVTTSKKTEVSPTYLARTSHDDGPIILTSDLNGSVKCFRIDCAFEKRHHWDTSSVFSKKGSSIRRSNSSKTHLSTSSLADSLEQSSIRTSIYRQNHLSWRGKSPGEVIHNSQREESMTPETIALKSNQQLSLLTSPINLGGETSEKPRNTPTLKGKLIPASKSLYNLARTATLPTPGFNLTNSIESDELINQSNQISKPGSFWNKSNWPSSLCSRTSHDIESKCLEKDFSKESDVDKTLKGENITDTSSAEENRSDTSDLEDDHLCCEMCDGKNFRARKISGKGFVMVCVTCGVIIG
ncbi:putative WD repeat-containing protein C3H5.08c [Erysiphe neolycopersici]|uniref:Putative WD repeat-containing protein C3H5.08c n=1 Tax=Erysiphe neolycopersici TaxID=212602 RepID=A0A420HE18_9PEZI|nr:putative WD repeat-containing protein C3H5.08c [Erysiphe neolycopersici]